MLDITLKSHTLRGMLEFWQYSIFLRFMTQNVSYILGILHFLNLVVY